MFFKVKKTKLHFTAGWIWKICYCSVMCKSQPRFIELKNKSSLSLDFLQRALRTVWCVCRCVRLSICTNVWIKAAGWDEVDAMGRLKSFWRFTVQQKQPVRVCIHQLSSMQSRWARFYWTPWAVEGFGGGAPFQALRDLQCAEECQLSLWWPTQQSHDAGKVQIS